MKRVTVLGAGRVGRVIARDLASDNALQVTVADQCEEVLQKLAAELPVNTVKADLTRPGVIRELVSGKDAAAGALPGFMGFAALKEVIQAKTPYVDISFMAEDPRVLQKEAEAAFVPALYDFGVAPGMSNLVAALEARRLAPARRIRIAVGGLPRVRRAPWEYEAPFSPADVVEEYIRPARVRVNGTTVEKFALSERETVELPEVGTLESFLTDGLRSLVDTVDCPNMEERTLRYPGYSERIRLLLDSGFLSTVPVTINGAEVVPLDLTRKLLDDAWLSPDEPDELTIMRIAVEGESAGRSVERVVHLYDETDRKRNETSMARTTGFPAAAAIRAMVSGVLRLPPGVHPPEATAGNETFIRYLFDALAARNVRYDTLPDRFM